jgi:hypothetical protein
VVVSLFYWVCLTFPEIHYQSVKPLVRNLETLGSYKHKKTQRIQQSDIHIVNTAGGSGQTTPKTGASQSAGGAVFKPIDAAYTVTPLQWRDKINFCDVQKSTRLVLRIKAMGSRKRCDTTKTPYFQLENISSVGCFLRPPSRHGREGGHPRQRATGSVRAAAFQHPAKANLPNNSIWLRLVVDARLHGHDEKDGTWSSKLDHGLSFARNGFRENG